jgi:hypothetical protein
MFPYCAPLIARSMSTPGTHQRLQRRDTQPADARHSRFHIRKGPSKLDESPRLALAMPMRALYERSVLCFSG